MNISGILVQTSPNKLQEVLQEIKSNNLWDYHQHDEKGRIIVTLEGENTDEEMKKLNQLKAVNHVITADMVYSYSEDELNEMRDDLGQASKVPDWMNDPNIKAEQIKYNGDLKKRH